MMSTRKSYAKLTEAGVPVVRKSNYRFTEKDPYWFGGNPLLTHLMNSLHIIVPEGEKFFIRSVKQQMQETPVSDPELQAQLKAFIGQEAVHFAAHHRIWDHIEGQYGPGFQIFSLLYQGTMFETIEPWLRKILPPKYLLAATAALEHFTAILAEAAFRRPEVMDGMSDEMRELIVWHSYEEIEHKSVAHDFLSTVDKSPGLRRRAMVAGTFGFWGYLLLGAAILTVTDRNFDPVRNLKALPGFLRVFQIMLSEVGSDYLDYYRADFHPDQLPVSEAAIAYGQRLNTA